MSRIELDHQGFKITYSENSDKWEVWELRIEAATLSKAKAKINQHVKDVVKNADLVFGLLPGWGSGVKKVQLISRDAKIPDKFWVIDGSGRRSCEKLSSMTVWSEDIETILEQAEALDKQASALSRQATALRATIKPMTKEQLDAILADLAKRITVEE